MTRIIALALAIAAGSLAHATESTVALDTATSEKITAMLTAQGYEIRKIEIEDGMYEAYALKDGNRYEIYLNAELDVVKTELDD
ncbi:PepSY domain-containing protein [Roseovarius faecimaris]|uniref:PepSY domain-containing protein n=1 Tax=Roseovarius faecimaris TaxID=2494550 RepID=A0A6I6IR45_9RHOB|nr:PepSY domain-containing protein [Roseovarius faecimaris]QGX98692.1 PepSY domain-containing protein [Roseovarius faecimaris]